MNFEEVFQKYKEGTANEEEKKYIEQELAKYKLMNEYIADEIDREYTVQEEGQEEDVIFSAIQKTIRRLLIKLSIVSAMIVLAVVLFIQFVLSPILDALYYNPAKFISDNGLQVQEIELDMNVYRELQLPFDIHDSVSAVPLGYGCYEISLRQVISRNGYFDYINGRIERGKMLLFHPVLDKRPASNVFVNKNNADNWAGAQADPKQQLQSMAPNSLVQLYISFQQDMTLQHVIDFMDEHSIYGSAAIRALPEEQDRSLNTMFFMALDPSGINLEGYDTEKYPYLKYPLELETISEEIAETHFKSMLQYMIDRDQFTALVKYDEEDYKAILQYVEENGILAYGATTICTPETALELLSDPKVYGILIGETNIN